jgi:hypothetical protein
VYGVVYGVSYYVDSEKALISEDERQECELRVKLRKLIVKSRTGRFWDIFSPLIYACRSNYFMHFMCLFIERLI